MRTKPSATSDLILAKGCEEKSNMAKSRCRLFELPAELQLYIYEFAVSQKSPIKLTLPCSAHYHHLNADARDKQSRQAQRRWVEGEREDRLQPSLSRTCKYLRAIVLPIYYGTNIFEGNYCTSPRVQAIRAWLTAIGPSQRRLLAKIYVYEPFVAYDECYPGYIGSMTLAVEYLGGMVTKVEASGCRYHLTFPEQEHP